MSDKNKQRMLKQLTTTPIVQLACKKASVSRATYYRWRKEDEVFAERADQSLEQSSALISEMAESQLISAIRDKNMAAIVFWLKHHHKAYETRVRVDASVRHEPQELNAEQAELVAQALRHAGLLPERVTDDESRDTV